MLPSTARWFVQFMPPPVTVIAAPLETASLNNLNLSPTISAGPRLDTVSVPMPVLVKMPLTTATSLDGDRDLLTLNTALPPSVRLLLIVSVPRDEVPGASVPGAGPLPGRRWGRD